MRRMVGALFLLMVGACGDDGGSSGGGSPKTAAARSPDNAASLKEAVSGAAEGTGLAAMAELYADMQIIYQNQQAKQLQQQAGGLEVREGALTPGCVTVAGNTATYTDCAEGPSTFNGTATVNGDVATFDVAVDVDPSAYNGPIAAGTAGVQGAPKVTLQEVSVRETGNLTITASRLDGTVNATIDLAMTIAIPGFGDQATSQSTPITATFAIDRDAAGCAVGGTMTVTSGDVTATAEYGPACGQVTLR